MVIADSRTSRDGKYIDLIGTYNPLTDPAEIQIDAEKAKKWLSTGAQPTDTVRSILVKEGILEAKPQPAKIGKKNKSKE